MALRKLVCLLFGCRERAHGADLPRRADGEELHIVCARCSRVRVRLVRVPVSKSAPLVWLSILLLCAGD